MTDNTAPPPELELWPRQHDLPPQWDGLAVTWREWEKTGAMFICPPPKKDKTCSRCQSARPPAINLGQIWTNPGTAPPAIGRGRLLNGRHLVGNLTAFRCVDCGHDQVHDSNGQVWELDPTDYTDEGSYAN